MRREGGIVRARAKPCAQACGDTPSWGVFVVVSVACRFLAGAILTQRHSGHKPSKSHHRHSLRRCSATIASRSRQKRICLRSGGSCASAARDLDLGILKIGHLERGWVFLH